MNKQVSPLFQNPKGFFQIFFYLIPAFRIIKCGINRGNDIELPVAEGKLRAKSGRSIGKNSILAGNKPFDFPPKFLFIKSLAPLFQHVYGIDGGHIDSVNFRVLGKFGCS